MDIVFFAAVALLIFLKLHKHLGQIDEEEKKNIEQKLEKDRAEILAMQQKIVEGMKVVNPLNQKDKTATAQIESAKNTGVIAINDAVKKDFFDVISACKISAEFFLDGAKMAFEMVVKAFADADLDTLKNLLSEKIYQNFSTAINDRKSQSQTLVTNIISIENAEIISVLRSGNKASIAMKISSKQINYITDAAGEIIKGSKTQIAEINDIWTFEKDVTSSNPIWFVVATHG